MLSFHICTFSYIINGHWSFTFLLLQHWLKIFPLHAERFHQTSRCTCNQCNKTQWGGRKTDEEKKEYKSLEGGFFLFNRLNTYQYFKMDNILLLWWNLVQGIGSWKYNQPWSVLFQQYIQWNIKGKSSNIYNGIYKGRVKHFIEKTFLKAVQSRQRHSLQFLFFKGDPTGRHSQMDNPNRINKTINYKLTYKRSRRGKHIPDNIRWAPLI